MVLRVISTTASPANGYKFGGLQTYQIFSDRLDAYHIFSEAKKKDLKNKIITKDNNNIIKYAMKVKQYLYSP